MVDGDPLQCVTTAPRIEFILDSNYQYLVLMVVSSGAGGSHQSRGLWVLNSLLIWINSLTNIQLNQ